MTRYCSLVCEIATQIRTFMLGLTAQQKGKFLAKLKTSHGNVSKAAQAIKISRSGVYQQKSKDPDFAAAWDDILASIYDAAEGELYKRAVVGWKEEPGGPTKKSDRLLEFFLKGNRAEKFRERFDINQQVSGSLDLNIQATIDQIYANTDNGESSNTESAELDGGTDQNG